jgi:phosphomannomutase
MPMTVAERFPNVAFGTSGLRALVSDLTSEAVSAYVHSFVQRMRKSHSLSEGTVVAVGIDLRPSSPTIAAVVCRTLESMGYRAEFLGPLPTPALALRCLSIRAPGVMVTGSHIPFDRNGIKFYTSVGEILKEDEQAIAACVIPEEWLEKPPATPDLPEVCPAAAQAYVERYVTRFGAQCLAGWRIGVYEHSAVGRDLAKTLLQRLGATVIALGRSDDFVPVDTEAVSDSDLRQAALWCAEHQLDALVSTDGDGDRPLVFDAKGQFIRGDVLGLLCARYLALKCLAIPVSCNTAVEKAKVFRHVMRTRIGSPYVVAAMNDLLAQGEQEVGGFEANGGFLLGSSLQGLSALPTRDALLPIVAVLSAAATQRVSLSTMVEDLPARFTYSDRLKDVPVEYSRALLNRLLSEADYQKILFSQKTSLDSIDTTDGVRLTFEDGDIIHIRPSGNAPELRCYAEANSFEAAKILCLSILDRIR